jgi:plastocyanin
MLRFMVRALIVVVAFVLAGCTNETAAPSAASPTPEATPATSEPPSPQPSAGAECVDASITADVQVRIAQRDNFFSPACLVVLGGQGLDIANRGANLHNFSIEGTQVDLDVPPGEVTRTEAIGGAVEPGTYTFFCKYHRSQGMEGELTITQAG